MRYVATVTVLTVLTIVGWTNVSAAQETRWIHPDCAVLPSDKTGPFVELSDGSLMTVAGNATIISKDNGETWSEPRPLYDGPEPGIPSSVLAAQVLLKTRDGVIILVYMDLEGYHFTWNRETDELDADLDVWAIRSLDEGKTWVDRQKILEGYCGALEDIIQTTSGHIIVPVQDALRNPVRHGQYTFLSDDDGKTWKRSNLIDIGGAGGHAGGFEGTLEELSDGRLLMLIRTPLGRFWEAYSTDQGRYWRELRPSQIDSSNSPGYLTRLSSGRLVLAWNRLYPEGKHSYEGKAPWVGVHRDELSIAFSEDDGKTWTKPVVIARQKGVSLAYPYIFERKPGELWVITDQVTPPLCLSLQEEDFVGG